MLRFVACFCFGMVLLAWSAGAAMAGKRVALVIGNSAYPKAPLTNPKNDAEDVAAALRRLQFDVIERKDVTVAAFDGAVDEFVEKAKHADVALFFFSGHGLQIDKRGFLVPVDFKAETESGALRELVPIQEVVSKIERAAKVSVVMLDACRDSPLQERMRRIAKEKDKAAVPAVGLAADVRFGEQHAGGLRHHVGRSGKRRRGAQQPVHGGVPAACRNAGAGHRGAVQGRDRRGVARDNAVSSSQSGCRGCRRGWSCCRERRVKWRARARSWRN